MRSLCLAVALALLLGGCVQNATTNLVLTAPGQRMKTAGSDTVGVKVSVSDTRIDRTSIGSARTADGSRTWILMPKQPVEEVVAKGVEAEFVARGFKTDGSAFLLVDIRQAECQGVMIPMGRPIHSAKVVLAAQVVDADGRTLYSQTYRGGDERAGNMFNSYDAARVVLQNVLVEVIREMGDDGRLAQALFEAKRRH